MYDLFRSSACVCFKRCASFFHNLETTACELLLASQHSSDLQIRLGGAHERSSRSSVTSARASLVANRNDLNLISSSRCAQSRDRYSSTAVAANGIDLVVAFMGNNAPNLGAGGAVSSLSVCSVSAIFVTWQAFGSEAALEYHPPNDPACRGIAP
jgi:hypothetical protein